MLAGWRLPLPAFTSHLRQSLTRYGATSITGSPAVGGVAMFPSAVMSIYGVVAAACNRGLSAVGESLSDELVCEVKASLVGGASVGVAEVSLFTSGKSA
jgi:hypothetical protein